MKKLTKPRKGERFAYWRDGNNDRVYEPKTLDNLEVGDVLVNNDGRKWNILGITGKIVAIEPSDGYGSWTWYSINDLTAFGYKPITNSKCPTCGR